MVPMTDMPEPGRKAAHVLLDMVSAFDWDDTNDAANSDAMNLAFKQMDEVGAVVATMDDEAGTLDLDLSNLIGGAAVTINWLVHLVSELSQRFPERQRLSPHDVIVKTREFLDENQ